MPTNFYDVIVLGDDLAGLIGAALCARRGLRVLVIETAETPPEKYAIGPYTLPRAPLPFPCEPSPAVRRVVAELSFIQSLKRRLQPLRPAFQIVLPDARLDVSADVDALGREVDRRLDAQPAAEEHAAGEPGDGRERRQGRERATHARAPGPSTPHVVPLLDRPTACRGRTRSSARCPARSSR